MRQHPTTLTVYKELSAMYLHFYVYAYIRINGSPYYIGKGHKNRAYSKHKNIAVPSDRSKIIFLEKGLTEIGAFALERRYIRWYGRKDLGTGILHNRTDGGEGRSGQTPWNKGKHHSEDTRKKISNAGKLRVYPKQTIEHIAKRVAAKKDWKMTPDQREALSIKVTGRKLSDETKEKMSMTRKGKPNPRKTGYKRGPYKKSNHKSPL